ncbi:UNVERIFIED_CONTAM: hypothetical protein HDU68_006268 [Siphonaria sp. JEL0065]|nr:hypothetical protein HDU68_006268 [Siphonaria sp. JEL0065]
MQVTNPDDQATVDFHPHRLQSTVQLDMSTIPAPVGNGTLTGPSTASFSSTASDFAITATRDPTTQLVTITLQTTAKGYVSIGFGASTMAGATMYVGWINGGSVVLSQRTASGHVTPTAISGTPDFSSPQSTLATGVIALTSAKISLSFKIPVSEISTTGPTSCIYSISDSPPSTPSDPTSSIAQHTSSQYGSFQLDLTKSGASIGGTTSSNAALFKLIHGILMFLAWGVFPFLGVFVARYMKAKLGHTWYIIHLCSMIGGVFLLSAAGMVVIELTVTGQRFITSTHGIVGTVITFGFLPLQIALGFVANHLFSLEREKVPWWDQMHWWVGRLVMLAALVNIYLGLTAYSAGIMWVGIYIGWVVIMFIILGVGQYIFGGPSHHVKGNKDFEMHDKRSYSNFDTRDDYSATPERLVNRKNGGSNKFDPEERGGGGGGPRGKATAAPPTRPGYNSPFDLGNSRDDQKKMGASGRGDAVAAMKQGRNNSGPRPNGNGPQGSAAAESPKIPTRGNTAGGGSREFGSGPRRGNGGSDFGSGGRGAGGGRGDVSPRSPQAAGGRTYTPDGRSRPGAGPTSPPPNNSRVVHGSLQRNQSRDGRPGGGRDGGSRDAGAGGRGGNGSGGRGGDRRDDGRDDRDYRSGEGQRRR